MRRARKYERVPSRCGVCRVSIVGYLSTDDDAIGLIGEHIDLNSNGEPVHVCANCIGGVQAAAAARDAAQLAKESDMEAIRVIEALARITGKSVDDIKAALAVSK